jgi:hypothetical protein
MYNVATQKNGLFIVTASRTSNPTYIYTLLDFLILHTNMDPPTANKEV